MSMQHLMTTAEVAAYLRLKERKIYDLASANEIPCTRVTGKLLFPKPLIDLWIASGTSGGGLRRAAPRPLVAVGSHDPLLEWALRQSGSDIAMLFDGSLNGLRRFLDGEALFCGLHVPDRNASDPLGETANRHLFGTEGEAATTEIVMLEWARRRQGLMVPKGNPLNLTGLKDLATRQAVLRPRQPEAGSRVLLETLILSAGLNPGDIRFDTTAALTESEAAAAVADGEVDTAFGIAAAAGRYGLDFIPLAEERYDLALDRRDFFDPPFQALMTVCRSAAFKAQAEKLGGYDVTRTGTVVFNS